MKFALIGFNCRYTHSCLSLFYLRQQLGRHLENARISLRQFTINDPYYATLQQTAALPADAFLFPVYIWNAAIITRLINDLAQIMPAAIFILGGPQAEALAPAGLPPRCTVVSGEIEGIDPAFYTDLRQGTLRPRYNGRRQATFASPFLPADFTTHLANRHIYYESSRGCPYGCSYCISALEPGVRYKDLAQVEDELRQILAHKPRGIRFVDRTFNASAARAMRIWQFLREEGGNTAFHFEIAPDLFTDEMFDFLRAVPPRLFEFEIGLQSTHGPTLAAINRQSSPPVALRNISRLAALDTIHLHVDLILGLPHETPASFAGSFNDVFAAGPHYIQMGLLKVLPHTPLSRQAPLCAITHCRQPPYEILSSRWLSAAELAELFWFGECVEAFYNNRYFRSFFACIRRQGRDGFRFFRHLLEACRQRDFFARARTQLLMSEILADLIRPDPEAEILFELLIFDWLRSGHRFLPEHLGPQRLREEKQRQWQALPEALAPFYTGTTRNEFFKQCLFARFSAPTLRQLGFGSTGRGGCLCFLNEREDSVLELTRVAQVGQG
jgi:hypothetical protein